MIRVLLVDDHPVVRHGLSALLAAQHDLEVVAAVGSSAEALDVVASRRVDVALVDLDLGVGAPDGIGAIAVIRRASPGTGVLVFSAFDADADVVRATDAGAVGYLVKDRPPAEVVAAIRSAARGGSPTASAAADRLRRRREHPDDALTNRELEVLALAAEGHSNRDLAAALHVSEATVKTHLHHAFRKLGADNRQAAIAAATRLGLLRR